MTVSVVMATYNGEKYIAEQLDSIFGQTCPPDELIICDDCSTDNTVAVVCEYRQKWPQIKLYRNETNLGFGNNFQKGLELATGDYIFFSDQDDIWVRDKIEIMCREMAAREDGLLLCSDWEPFGDGELRQSAEKRTLKTSDPGSVEKLRLTKDNLYLGALGCCMCMKKSLREKMREYWFDGWAHDDRCWKLALCMDGCYLLHRNLVKHRIHENNTATFGVYHTVKKRLRLLSEDLKAWQQTEICAKSCYVPDRVIKDIQNIADTLRLRVELIGKRKYVNGIRLIGKLRYYHTKKSYLVEWFIAVRQPSA